MGTIFGIFMFATILSLLGFANAFGKRKKDENAISKAKTWGIIFAVCLIGTFFSFAIQNQLLIREAEENRRQELVKKQAEPVKASAPVTTPIADKPTPTVAETKPVTQQKEVSQAIRVSAADLIAEPNEYLGKEVIVGPLMIWYNKINTSTFNTYGYNPKTRKVTPNQEIYINYDKMPNKRSLHNLEDSHGKVLQVRGIMDRSIDEGNKIVPIIVPKEIVFLK